MVVGIRVGGRGGLGQGVVVEGVSEGKGGV